MTEGVRSAPPPAPPPASPPAPRSVVRRLAMLRQTLLEGLLAIAAALAMASALAPQAASDDPFRGTLSLVPLVVAALRALERHGSPGDKIVATGERRLAAVAFAALFVVALHRHRFGLVVTDWFLAAGLLLLLLHRVARLLLVFRPLLGRHLPRRPSGVFFLLPLIVYLAIQPWSSQHRQPDGDEPYYLLITHSLAHDLDLDLTNNYAADWRRFMDRRIEPQPGDPLGPQGEKYSRHSFLLPLALAPAYRIAERAGAMALMAVMTAALAWMLLRLAHHYAPRCPGAALLAYGLFAFSPPLLLYSYQIWVEVPAALLLTLALDRLLVLRQAQRISWRQLALLVVPIAILPILKLRFGLLIGPLLLLVWWRLRNLRATLAWGLGSLGGLAAGLLAFNLWRFGNPLRIYQWSILDLSVYSAGDFLRGAIGIFYDAAFGLFGCAPIWLLLLPAFGWLAQRRSSLLTDLAVLSVPYLLFMVPRIEWFGGWSPAFRYPLVLLPLLALTLVPLLEGRRRPALRALIAGLGSMTLVLTLMWVVFPGWTYNFADGRTHFLDEAGVRLGADVARFFPSTVRPRPATWLWLAASLLLIPLGYRWSRSPASVRVSPARDAVSWGVAMVLLALPVVAAAGRLWPSQEVHLEDGFVRKEGGVVYPSPWTLQRPRYQGGWTLAPGGQLTAPVAPGGERVEIELHSRLEDGGRTAELYLAAGPTHLETVTVSSAQWVEMPLGPFDWPAGEPLVIRLAESADGVIVDRVEMGWR
ncbi:MAG: hypothetical protein AAF657_01705 [Acidobacteriota bacterium]